MRMSGLFGQTIREIPSNAQIISHQLLLRAGYICQAGVGVFSFLPLAKRSLTKIENIIRQEINKIGGQEVVLPALYPSTNSLVGGHVSKSGNTAGNYDEAYRSTIGLTSINEEVYANLIRKEIRSYRQLPQLLYHFHQQWNNNLHPNAGLLDARESLIAESYSFDKNWEGLEKQYYAIDQAYQEIFLRCDLPVMEVNSDPIVLLNQSVKQFIYPSPIGGETVIICDNCGYKSNERSAKAKKIPFDNELVAEIEKVPTPNSKTITELASYLSISPQKTAKAVFRISTFIENDKKYHRFVFAIVRGDMEVNETKLARCLQSVELRPATDAEIRAVGAFPGYASPVGLQGVLTIVDELIPQSPNLVSGANIEGYHFRNVNFGRDYTADFIADITSTRAGDSCIDCGHPYHSFQGVAVGKMAKIGTGFSESHGCYYLDGQGISQPIVMGSYSINPGHLLACIAEEHHDEHGLIWPIAVSPFQIHLISLPWKTNDVTKSNLNEAESLYHKLLEENFECLIDDRNESPGVKFNDADLIGIPIRLTISERSLKNGGVEYKRRDKAEKSIIPVDNIIPALRDELRLIEYL